MASIKDTEALAARLLKSHGLAAQGWHFSWDNAKKRGGQCNHTFKRITMSRNLVPLWEDNQVLDTLVHEVAHALVGPGHGHGPVWKRKMRELGAVPARTHNNATAEPHLEVICPTHGVIGKRHRRMRGAACRGCGNRVTYNDTRLVRA